jgi:hypothetical protein
MYVSVKSSINIPFFLSDLIFKSDLFESMRSLNFSIYNSTNETLIRNYVFYVLELMALKTCPIILGMIPDSAVISYPT